MKKISNAVKTMIEIIFEAREMERQMLNSQKQRGWIYGS